MSTPPSFFDKLCEGMKALSYQQLSNLWNAFQADRKSRGLPPDVMGDVEKAARLRTAADALDAGDKALFSEQLTPLFEEVLSWRRAAERAAKAVA